MTDVRNVDRTAEALLHQLWQIGWDADSVGRPWHTYRTWTSARREWPIENRTRKVHLRVAYDGDRPVGWAEARLPLLDNLHLAMLDVFVHPEDQRRGHGSALLVALSDILREEGRTTALLEVAAPVAAESGPLLFARAQGFAVAQQDEMKVADLRETASSWAPLLASTEAVAVGYQLLTWSGACPDHLVDAYCELASRFIAEIPLGDLAMEPEVWDRARLRENEERQRLAGRSDVTTIVLGPDGTGVGYTEMMVAEERPDLAYQGATIVLPGHRGHRLGQRLKATNHLAFTRAHPGARNVITGNASENVHMNAINDQLGFRVVERCLEMQRTTAGL